MVESEKADVDTVVILSSDLIATIAQDYFNKVLFKKKVEVVDLQASSSGGYAFGLKLSAKTTPGIQPQVELPTQGVVVDSPSHTDDNVNDDDLNLLVLESLDSFK